MNFDRLFDSQQPTVIIAEIGNNHNGSLKRALELIDLAKDCGVDCVKFQIRNKRALYRSKTLEKDGDDLGSEYIIDLLKKFELTPEEHKIIFNYTKTLGIGYMCTPWDQPSMDILADFGVQAIKIASADMINLPLLSYVAKFNLPMVLSTGMSTEAEICTTVAHMNSLDSKYVLLHCNSTYPAPFEDINLRWMFRLQEIHPHIGYSGHERGTATSIAAVALGAHVLERHFTLDRNMEGPDHAASLEPDEFKVLVQGVRQVEVALGNGGKKLISQGELINRENLGKSLIASRDLEVGHELKPEDIKIKSPGQGLSPQRINEVIGKKILKPKQKDDFIFESDIFTKVIDTSGWHFKMRWGIPVRPHDVNSLITDFQPDLVEFHLSYTDLKSYKNTNIVPQSLCDLLVHAPELFDQSHLLDLASPDPVYRKASIANMREVIDVSLKLKEKFSKTENVLIITNVGGFSMDKPIDKSLHTEYYGRIFESLECLKTNGVEIIPQSMAPFPWHFGGQRLQNLFVHPDEIAECCVEEGLRICLDISHTKLVCNTFGYDFYTVIQQLAPYVAHLHVGDALGRNGEGLQIGDGDIDFKKLGETLKLHCPSASFIPEIWQGHKDSGLGFKVALSRLVGCL